MGLQNITLVLFRRAQNAAHFYRQKSEGRQEVNNCSDDELSVTHEWK